jgi:hypothetical protein
LPDLAEKFNTNHKKLPKGYRDDGKACPPLNSLSIGRAMPRRPLITSPIDRIQSLTHDYPQRWGQQERDAIANEDCNELPDAGQFFRANFQKGMKSLVVCTRRRHRGTPFKPIPKGDEIFQPGVA